MFQGADSSFLQSRRHNEFNVYRKNGCDEDELNNLFNKKFKFRFNREWCLPEREAWFSQSVWSIRELDTLKSKLNFHKSQLNDFNIEEWSSHTRRRNPAGEVCWKLRNVINPEFLTQAWTKFYECACTYNIIPDNAKMDGKMVSLHLCEAPGAFITSLNHYLKSNFPHIDFQWIASTLNPYYEGNSPSTMINDDRFMFHTLEHWDFGVDNTGNLMDWENSQAIIKRAKSLGKVYLVTADGSIDCLQKPDAQEEMTSPLHYCEIVTALQALSEGGTFIFKLFTMFEHSTVNLMFLINNLFSEVNIYKPVTSRQGNSEVYAICLKYKGSSYLDPYLPILKSSYGTELYLRNSLFPLNLIPSDFTNQIEECAYYFCSIQCQVINNNLQAYLMQQNMGVFIDMKKVRSWVATAFLRLYGVRPLMYDQEILKGILHQEDQKINTNPRYHRGSYSERQLYEVLSLKEKAKNLLAFLDTEVFCNSAIFINIQVLWVTLYEPEFDIQLTYTYGKPISRINSSKLIFVPIYKLYLQILAEERFRDIVLNQNDEDTTCDLNFMNKNIQVLSLPLYNYTEPYAIYEKRCFKMFFNILKELSIEDSIVVRNFVTLTHFNVSILFIVCKKCFERVGFTMKDGIILQNLKNKDAIKYLDMIESECLSVTSGNNDVMSVLPVQLTNTVEFFNSIVCYNNTFYRYQCAKNLGVIEKELC